MRTKLDFSNADGLIFYLYMIVENEGKQGGDDLEMNTRKM